MLKQRFFNFLRAIFLPAEFSDVNRPLKIILIEYFLTTHLLTLLPFGWGIINLEPFRYVHFYWGIINVLGLTGFYITICTSIMFANTSLVAFILQTYLKKKEKFFTLSQFILSGIVSYLLILLFLMFVDPILFNMSIVICGCGNTHLDGSTINTIN